MPEYYRVLYHFTKTTLNNFTIKKTNNNITVEKKNSINLENRNHTHDIGVYKTGIRVVIMSVKTAMI